VCFVVSDLGTFANADGKPNGFTKWVNDRANTEAKRLVGLVQMAIGIKCVKGSGLVHRDVKPPNFLVSADAPYRVMINDFGLSTKPCRHIGGIGAKGLPNCARNDDISMDCCTESDRDTITDWDDQDHGYKYWPDGATLSSLRSDLDVYSLGVTYKEMMAAQATFLSSGVKAMVTRVVRNMMTTPHHRIEQVLLDLMIILRGVNKDAAKQAFAQIKGLYDEVDGFLTGILTAENDVHSLLGRINAIKERSIFNRRRWTRWCFNHDDYDEVENLKTEMRTRQAEIGVLKQKLNALAID